MGVLATAVEGNRQKLDGGAMFGNVPRALWAKWTAPDDRGRIELACRSLLIEMDGQRILLETGIGVFFDPKFAERYGVEQTDHQLLNNLAALGVEPESIDYVILSHLHFDHAGGLLPTFAEIAQKGMYLLFSRAKYVIGRAAFERAQKPHPRDRASFIAGMTQLLEQSGRLILIDELPHDGTIPGLPTGVLPESLPAAMQKRLSFRFSHGHTPGQMHTVVKGDFESFVFAGDLVPGTPWVHLPVTMGYDRFAELVIDEKRALYEECLKNGWQLFFTHDSEFAAAQLALEAGKFSAKNSRELLTRTPF